MLQQQSSNGQHQQADRTGHKEVKRPSISEEIDDEQNF
jgi:hypothetical protein